MAISDAVILGAVQGLTEFVPVSSTAHLFLTHRLLGLETNALSLAFDITLHFGTLVALFVVYWNEIGRMVGELVRWIARKPAKHHEERALILPIIIGTLPGVLAGLFLLPHIVEERSPVLIGAAMLTACAYFFLAEARGVRAAQQRTHPSTLDALWVGIAQGAAGVMAGFSRSGFTISTGRLRGLDRAAAAKFSFLLSMPIIFGAGVKSLLDLRDAPEAIPLSELTAGFLASAVTGYLAVRFLLRFLKTHTLRPFAVYLGILGAVLILTARSL